MKVKMQETLFMSLKLRTLFSVFMGERSVPILNFVLFFLLSSRKGLKFRECRYSAKLQGKKHTLSLMTTRPQYTDIKFSAKAVLLLYTMVS